jgi:hypothetical protein
MNNSQEQRYHCLYEQHLINLRLQGERPSTISYTQLTKVKQRDMSRAVNKLTDKLTITWSVK